MPFKLHSIIASTRPGRVGPAVARWFHAFAQRHGHFDTELIDRADFNLPVYDEPVHPSLQQYEHEHTKRWSQSVAAADAYVFVTPEYNYCPPPSLVNAFDFVYREWNYKPCGFVNYGGVSGALRAVQMERLHATTLKMVPLMEGVTVPTVAVTSMKTAPGCGRSLHLNGSLRPARCPASSAVTQKRFGWQPQQSDLIADLEDGFHFES